MTLAFSGLIAQPTSQPVRVEIPMPLHFEGELAGKPVGWLALNKKPKAVKASIRWDRAVSLWRIGARDAYRSCKVPKMSRVFVTFEVRYAAGTKQRHDPGGLEPTIKPIIDALQPQKVVMHEKTVRRGKQRVRTLVPVIHYGWGVIPNDNAKYVVRGGEVHGEDLPRDSKLGGMIVIYIFPYGEVAA